MFNISFFLLILSAFAQNPWRPAPARYGTFVGRVSGARACVGYLYQGHVVSTATCLKSNGNLYFTTRDRRRDRRRDRLARIYLHKKYPTTPRHDYNLAIAKFASRPQSIRGVTQGSARAGSWLNSYRFFNTNQLYERSFTVVAPRTCEQIYLARYPSASRERESLGMKLCTRLTTSSTRDEMTKSSVGSPLIVPGTSQVVAVYNFATRYQGERYYFFDKSNQVTAEFR